MARTPPWHWTEYLVEAAALGAFMLSAAAWASALYCSSSPLSYYVADEQVRRLLMGLAMGATAVAIIYSPLGQRSGAHMNPAVTIAFHRLGKIGTTDAVGYVIAQFAGGVVGLATAAALFGDCLNDPGVRYVVTQPGPAGAAAALGAEFTMSFLLMLAVLRMTSTAATMPYTGLVAGGLVCAFIAFESPLSGMSMNPARTVASAIVAGEFTGIWIYFSAPVAGMLAAVHVFCRTGRLVACAKLHHPIQGVCHFGCNSSTARPKPVPTNDLLAAGR
ncbi:MAG: MIP/aquaporin family protein [Vicinamibacterales bacterium]